MSKCAECGLDVHRDQGTDYMGLSVRHKHRQDCLRGLKARITELEHQLSACRGVMKHAQSIGCVDHLDCADDGGKFWHEALSISIDPKKENEDER